MAGRVGRRVRKKTTYAYMIFIQECRPRNDMTLLALEGQHSVLMHNVLGRHDA